MADNMEQKFISAHPPECYSFQADVCLPVFFLVYLQWQFSAGDFADGNIEINLTYDLWKKDFLTGILMPDKNLNRHFMLFPACSLILELF